MIKFYSKDIGKHSRKGKIFSGMIKRKNNLWKYAKFQGVNVVFLIHNSTQKFALIAKKAHLLF